MEHRRDDITCALIEAGAFDPDLRTSLVWAVGTKRLATVQALLAKGADVNQKTYSGQPLLVAARAGLLPIARALVEAGADLDAGNTTGTPLQAAIEAGHADLALLLLAAGATPSALEAAAAAGLVAVVEELVRRGHPVDAVCSRHARLALRDFTALHAACHAGQRECAEVLLAAGADPHLRDGEGRDALEVANPEVREWLVGQGIQSRRTAEERLRLAAQSGEPLESILGEGPDLDARDPRRAVRGRTALALAAGAGHLDAVASLLAAGASPDLADADEARPGLKRFVDAAGEEMLDGEPVGRTPLLWACLRGHREVAEVLLKAGADPRRTDFLGYHPLFLAAREGHRPVVQALLGAGVPVDHPGPGKSTPLVAALERRHRECALDLLEAGASVKGTPIMEAAEMADPELLQRMIRRKASLKGTKKLAPPLARACGATRQVPLRDAPPGNWVKTHNEKGSWATIPQPEEQILEAVEVLLQAGADVNEPGWLGPPLMVAAHYGLPRVVKRLLAAGADPDVTYNEGTALSVAELFEHEKVIEILRPLTGAGAAEEPAEQPVEEEAATPELPIPEFTPTEAFREAVKELEELCGSPAVAKEYLRGGVEIHVHTGKREGFSTLEAQRRWLPKGVFVFEPEYSRATETIAVVPTGRWQDLIALRQTNGINLGVTPLQVVAFLEKVARKQPFELQTVSHDTVSGVFTTPIKDPRTMAGVTNRICPDVVTQGCGTIHELVKEFRKKPARLFLWWD